ncbi:MAG: alpha-ketoacid dehydrogenase subunit beta, partial [Luteolibacter sp.]
MSRTLTYREALREGLDEELARDPNVVLMGEEVAQYNGAYKVTEGLWKKWGDKRVVDTPISEAGFIGMGIGASMLGVRPVMELMFWSFHSVAFDQLVNNAACVRYMSGGLCHCPIVVRGPANGGTNVGATHSHIPEGLFAAFPGLKVCAPATPADAKGRKQVWKKGGTFEQRWITARMSLWRFEAMLNAWNVCSPWIVSDADLLQLNKS